MNACILTCWLISGGNSMSGFSAMSHEALLGNLTTYMCCHFTQQYFLCEANTAAEKLNFTFEHSRIVYHVSMNVQI